MHSSIIRTLRTNVHRAGDMDHHGKEHEMRTNTMSRKPHKRYRVKSRVRFITSLAIMIGLMFGVGSFALGHNDSIALTKHETQTVYVQTGDSLWNIAREYKSDKTDIRKAVYKICQINDIEADQLQSGMILEIPYDI